MNKARLFALTTALCLAACGTDKPAASDTAAAVPPPDSSPAVTPTAAVAESAVVAQSGKAAVPSKATVTTTKAAPVPVAAPAPAAAKPAAAPVPAVQPAAQPTAKPAAPVPTVAEAPSAPRADPAMGAPLYDANCKKCHGARGVPVKVMQAKFPKMLPFDAAFLSKNTDAAMVDIMMNGKGTNMKSFTDKLSHAEMVSVAAYIRTFAP